MGKGLPLFFVCAFYAFLLAENRGKNGEENLESYE